MIQCKVIPMIRSSPRFHFESQRPLLGISNNKPWHLLLQPDSLLASAPPKQHQPIHWQNKPTMKKDMLNLSNGGRWGLILLLKSNVSFQIKCTNVIRSREKILKTEGTYDLSFSRDGSVKRDGSREGDQQQKGLKDVFQLASKKL